MNGISGVDVGNMLSFSHYGYTKEPSQQPVSSVDTTTVAASPMPVENGRHRKGSLNSLETQNLSKTPLPRATTSLANGFASSPSPSSPHNTSRRPSWLANISSKFSSSPTSTTSAEMPPSPTSSVTPVESPKSRDTPPGFLISTLRRLSSSSSNARDAFGRRGSAPAAGPYERVILNKDETRERSCIPELEGTKLRKVSFCVDVEVAPCHEDIEAKKEARRKRREAKEKEKEKERLKQLNEDKTPELAIPNCDGAGADGESSYVESDKVEEHGRRRNGGLKGSEATLVDDKDSENLSRPQGPVDEGAPTSPTQSTETAREKQPKPRRRVHPKPTRNPLKIYTQCCQLRETRILPEVKEQLLKENCPAVLQVMNLTGYKFQLADAVTFADFLALVPIKRLILEDCDLTDEMVRMVLSGLSAVKPIPLSEERDESSVDRSQDSTKERHYRGVVERLSLKNNHRIGTNGWRYISCFVHMSHSLKALDLSKVIFPRPIPAHVSSHHNLGRNNVPKQALVSDTTMVFSRVLGERLCGHGLEELVMGHCRLSSEQLKHVLEGVITGGTKRLGLEGNALTDDGLAMIGRWMKGIDTRAGICEALDLSNNNVQDHIDILSASINELSPLCALNLSNCNISPTSLSSLLPALAILPHFRWLDLSNNPLLFSVQPDALTLLRRFLPRMHALRKIDLANTSMTTDHAIALCEILPEAKQLAFFKITENPSIQSGQAKMNEGSMEEGAALYTALVAAVKVSKSIVRVDVDEPGTAAGDVIRRLSKRLLAYCLRNMEAGATREDWTVDTAAVSRESSELKHAPPEYPVPVGDLEDDDRAVYEYDEDGVWQDEENYVVGGTGVVKALGVCLGNKPQYTRVSALTASFPALRKSDTVKSIGSLGDDESGQEKANEMSKALLTRARSIKARIQPALRKGYSGDIEEMHHRRLLFLDDTLHRVIHRFEEEYPECRQPLPSVAIEPLLVSVTAPSSSTREISTTIPQEDQEFENEGLTCSTHISRPASRRGSEVSLHSKFLQNEEGQMHKLGQYMKHDIFADTPQSRHSEVMDGEDVDADDPVAKEAQREQIRRVVQNLDGEELKRRIIEVEGGVNEYISNIGGEKRAKKWSESGIVLNSRSDSSVA